MEAGFVMSKPYYQQDGITIYHGDCRKILPALPPVGAVITDPPYGLGDRMQGGTWGAADKYADMRKWDEAPTGVFLTSLAQLTPICVLWGGNYFRLPPTRCWLVWDKQNAVETMSDVEMAWTSLDRPSKRISLPVGTHIHGHPTEKPLPLMIWTLMQIKNHPSPILDPYMGSGTTLVAAKMNGQRAIGIEIEERYCEIAAKRLGQGVLFGASHA